MRLLYSLLRDGLRASLPVALALAFLGACNAGGSDVTPPITTPSIGLSLSASAVTATGTTPGTVTVTVTRAGGFVGAVAVAAEGLPTGVTAVLAPALLEAATTSSVLTLTVGSTAAAGTTTISVRVSGSGVTDATTTAQLTVGLASITLSAGVTTASARVGLPASIPITITRINGYAGNVILTAEGVPANVTATFTPASLASGVNASTLSLAPLAGAPLGTSTVTIRASGGGIADKTTTFQFTIAAAAVSSAPPF